MKIDHQGLLIPTTYLPSPYYNERPENTPIDMIVIHNISLPPNQFGTGCVERFFCGELDFKAHSWFAEIADLQASSHLFINRLGEVIQFVPFVNRAWHAGKSAFQGRENCNDYSIGIELEGTDDLPFETVQYERLNDIIRVLREAYPLITRERIVGHSDVAPGRKTDPGPCFYWEKVR